METFHNETNTFARNLTAFFDKKFKSYSLATSYIELLLLLRQNGGFTQKELAESLSMAPSTITRFIDKLVKQGFVKKKRQGREVIVELTEKGSQLSSEMEDVYQSAVDELKELVGEKFVITVGKLLKFGNDSLKDAGKE